MSIPEHEQEPVPEQAPAPDHAQHDQDDIRLVAEEPVVTGDADVRVEPESTDHDIRLTDVRIDPDRMLLADVDTTRSAERTGRRPPPVFTVSEMARFFFARTSHWVRWLEGEGQMRFDGEPIQVGRTPAGARAYTLADVERIAHGLAQQGAITGQQLRHTLLLVATQARMYELI